ncbi:MAG: hypothetical protein K6G51_01565 [Sphaerochaetaceae bacterium]|nr:hypothetical protein [Sphaerochaetaceae bacterium]
MKALCVYIDGGKGHYVPAKAVEEKLAMMGHEAKLVEFFELLDIKAIGRINKRYWRTMLMMPKYERKMSEKNDQSTNGMDSASKWVCRLLTGRMKRIVEAEKPDFIFTTHPYPNRFLTDLLIKAGHRDIPVYYFATDVFSVPKATINNGLDKFYVSTIEGLKSAAEQGQREESLKLVPFPLQDSLASSPVLSKAEARKKLDLDENLFTLQLNLGGEGLGTTGLLERLGQAGIPMQIVIIGGMRETMRGKLEAIIKSFPPQVKGYIRGFVSNVNEYVYAADMVAGRAGINTIVETIYANRPFLITETVYTVLASADYIERYKLGWNAAFDYEKQASIVLEYANDPEKLKEFDDKFEKVPITYGADKLAKIMLSDIEEFKKNLK